MMKMIGKEVDKMSYVKHIPEFEARKQRFFNGERDEAESNIMSDIMHKIGHFQIPENNLEHIKGVSEVKSKNDKIHAQKELKKKSTLQIPRFRMQPSLPNPLKE